MSARYDESLLRASVAIAGLSQAHAGSRLGRNYRGHPQPHGHPLATFNGVIARTNAHGSVAVPARLGPLIGRDHESQELRELVLSGAPLVTVTGLSGVGKTRLVQEAVGDLLVAWFSAADLDDQESLIPSIQQWAESRLASTDAQPQLIAVDSLDNPSIGPGLVSVLDRYPNVRVVATSRGRLHVQGEVLFRLLPLRHPPVGSDLDPTRPDEWEAVQCFLRTAKRVAPAFQLNDSNTDAVAELMRLSGGLPLAIELAAQWLRVCGIDELVARARRSLEPFSGGSADLPAHQQDLRASIRATIDELPADDVQVLEVLAQLGPVSLAGLEQGLGGSVGLDVLGRLIDRNIVESGAARRAITIHPLIRQEVAARTEGSAARRRFLEWLQLQVADAVPQLPTSRSRAAFGRLDDLASDIAAGLDMLPEHPEQVSAVIASLSDYWGLTRSQRVEVYWTTRALSLVGDASPQSARLHLAACRAMMVLDGPDAQFRGERALELARQSSDLQVYAEALDTVNTMRYNAGRSSLDDSVNEGIDICRVNGWASTLCDLLSGRALALHQWGRRAEGRQVAMEAIEAARGGGELHRMGVGLLVFSDISVKMGEFDEALRASDEALRLAADLDPRCGLAPDAHSGRAASFLERGELEPAIAAARAAAAGFEEIESAVGLAQALRDLGHCLACAGESEEAMAVFARSIELWRAVDQPFLALVTLLTVVVSPPPASPPLELCARVFTAVDDSAPGFIERQGGYWSRLLEARRAELVEVRPPGPVPSEDELVDLVLAHLRAEPPVEMPLGLTPREGAVLGRLALGATDREIAAALHLSVRTVNSHVAAILRKLQVDHRRQAAAWYREHPFADV